MSLQDLTYEIGYNVDTSGLSKSLDILNSFETNLVGKAKEVESMFSNIGKASSSITELSKVTSGLNVDGLSSSLKNSVGSSNELNLSTERQQRLEKLVDDYVDEYNTKLEKSSDLTEQWNNRTVELNKPLSQYAEEQQKIDDEINQSINKTDDLASSVNKVSENTSKAKDKTDELKNSLGAVNKVSGGIGNMLGAFGFIGIGYGVASGIKGAIGAFTEFQQEMANVHATLGDVTNNDLTALSNKAIEISNNYGISSAQISQGEDELASHGLNAKQIMDTIQPSTLLAVAGNIKMKDSTLDVSSALRNFNLDMSQAGHVADTYAAAAASTAAAMPDMAQALKNVAPIAGEVGYSIEETAADIGALADKGIKGGIAGTDLKIMIERLISPVGKGAELIKELGFNAIDPTTGKLKSMSTVIRDLNKAFESHGLTTAPEKNSALSIIFGKEALPGTAAIFGTAPDQLDKLTKSLENSKGAAQKMADTMNDTLQGSLNKLKSKIDNVFITDISKTTLGKSMKNFIDSVNTNMPTIENNLAWVLNGALKIGSGIKQNWGPISDTVLEVGLSFLTLKGILTVAKFAESISVLGKLSAPILLISMSVGAAATGFKDIKEGNKGLGALMLGTAAGLDAMAAALLLTDMSLGPVILVGVAVAALATGIIYFKSNWAQTWINIKETTMEYVNPIIDKINGLITLLDKIPGVNIGKISDIKMSSDDIKMAQSLGMSPDQIQKLTGSENKIQSFKPTSGTQALTNMVSNNNNVYSWFPKTKYASGTDYATGGTALVGEKGPEIVNLPTGSQVIPAQQTASMLSNTNSKMGTGAAASQNGFNSSTKKLLAENKAIIMDYVSHQTVYGQNSVKNFSTAVLDREPLATTATNKVSTDNKNIMSNLANSALTYGTQIDTELGQGIKDSEGSLLSIVDDLATKVVQQFKVTFGIASPSKVMYRIGDFLGQGLINGMQANDINSFITKWIGDTSSLTQNGLGSVIGQLLQPMFVSGDNKGIISMVYNLVHNGLGSLFSSGGAVSGNVAEWLTAAIALTGAPMSWLPALEMIAMGESGGDPMSINTYDINAQEGHPSEGLMQLIQENMDDYHLPGMTDIFNPIENGAASIRLIEHDYGSPWNTPGVRSEMAGGPYMGYAGGTSNATPGIHLVGEKGPELVSFNGGEKVTPNNQLASISQKPYFAGGSDVKAEISPNISFNIYESKDPRATAQEVYKVLKQHFGDLFDEKMGTLKIQMGFR